MRAKNTPKNLGTLVGFFFSSSQWQLAALIGVLDPLSRATSRACYIRTACTVINSVPFNVYDRASIASTSDYGRNTRQYANFFFLSLGKAPLGGFADFASRVCAQQLQRECWVLLPITCCSCLIELPRRPAMFGRIVSIPPIPHWRLGYRREHLEDHVSENCPANPRGERVDQDAPP